MKPVLNLDELELQSHEQGPFAARFSPVGEKIGARLLGYNVTAIPPGKKAVPFHNHRNNEEVFLILDGEGTLRFGDRTYPLRKHDIVACPPGGREVAHQIINTGTTELRYLALGTR
ncbi:MAG TPA: cupin domain-containing protein, partial [Polyangia bacterium]